MRSQAAVLVLAILACFQILHAQPAGSKGLDNPRPVQAILLWHDDASKADSVDQESFAAALMGMGFSYARMDPADVRVEQLGLNVLLVVPHASARALSKARAKEIIAYVKRGMRLLTDGQSPLTDAMRITFGSPERVTTVVDQSLPDIRLYWPDGPSVRWIAGYAKSAPSVLYSDSASHHPLGIALRVGQGRCAILAPLFDPVSGRGYSRFPTLPNAILQFLECRPLLKRNAVDAYFDPGYRFKIPIEKLAAQWRSWGIRAVHAASWYDNDSPPYDYKRLIEAAHKNGILVYAWLEWPHLGRGFWNQHPEWRQKNALLQDAKLDFLHLMDLQNPNCLEAALNNLSMLLKEDWDGIDIAEFTITGAGGEALKGPTRPDYFVPFTPTAIAEFQQLAGFDPRELIDESSHHFWKRDSSALDQFYRYRTSVNNRLLRRVVEFVDAIKEENKRDWELIHTIVDNSLHPEFDFLLGFDQPATLALLREFEVTLNVEDPYMEWLQPPDRYRRLRQTLAALVPERPAMIDINVVPIHPSSQLEFASEQATGIEFFQQLQHAGAQGGRVCVYCESSVFSHDWLLVSHAMAVGASAAKTDGGWELNSPVTVTLNVADSSGAVLVDGRPWPCVGPEGIIVPAGSHRVSYEFGKRDFKSQNQKIRLLSLSDELLGCRMLENGMELTYRSVARCMLAFNIRPTEILLDGKLVTLPVLNGEERVIVIAPAGTHQLSILEE